MEQMPFDTYIRYYGERHSLTEGDVEFMIGLMQRAISEAVRGERIAAAKLAWEMQSRDFGGGTAIGNAIHDGKHV